MAKVERQRRRGFQLVSLDDTAVEGLPQAVGGDEAESAAYRPGRARDRRRDATRT
jgi:hypothetical protein